MDVLVVEAMPTSNNEMIVKVAVSMTGQNQIS